MYPIMPGSCWGILADNCDWDAGYCVELVSGDSCLVPQLATWNVSVGLNNTMIFATATDNPNGTLGLCLDWNVQKNLTELWPCGDPGKENQEWFVSPNGGIGEFANGGCICIDQNSRTQSASASSSASASQSQTISNGASQSISVTPSPTTPPLRQQRITTCPCDGSLNQQWLYPEAVGSMGAIYHAESRQCWSLVVDNCAAIGGYCIELDVSWDV